KAVLWSVRRCSTYPFLQLSVHMARASSGLVARKSSSSSTALCRRRWTTESIRRCEPLLAERPGKAFQLLLLLGLVPRLYRRLRVRPNLHSTGAAQLRKPGGTRPPHLSDRSAAQERRDPAGLRS